jgi:galactose-1-phosphate uridylyltransferase
VGQVVAAHAFNPSTQEAEDEFEASLVYRVRTARTRQRNPVSKKKKKKKKKRKKKKKKCYFKLKTALKGGSIAKEFGKLLKAKEVKGRHSTLAQTC